MDLNLAVLIHKQIWWPSCKFLGPASSDPLALPWATLGQAARAVQLVLWLLGLQGHRALETSCAARWRGLRLEHCDWTPEAHGRQTQKLLPKIHMAGSPILPMAGRMSKSPGTRCINQPAAGWIWRKASRPITCGPCSRTPLAKDCSTFALMFSRKASTWDWRRVEHWDHWTEGNRVSESDHVQS